MMRKYYYCYKNRYYGKLVFWSIQLSTSCQVLREAVFAAHQSGKGYKPLSKQYDKSDITFLQWEGLFINGNPWQLLIFPGVGNSLHHVIMWSTGLCKHIQFMFITAQPVQDWTNLAFIEGCAKTKPLLSKNDMTAWLRFAKSVQITKVLQHFFGLMRPRWRSLVIIHSTMFSNK